MEARLVRHVSRQRRPYARLAACLPRLVSPCLLGVALDGRGIACGAWACTVPSPTGRAGTVTSRGSTRACNATPRLPCPSPHLISFHFISSHPIPSHLTSCRDTLPWRAGKERPAEEYQWVQQARMRILCTPAPRAWVPGPIPARSIITLIGSPPPSLLHTGT